MLVTGLVFGMAVVGCDDGVTQQVQEKFILEEIMKKFCFVVLVGMTIANLFAKDSIYIGYKWWDVEYTFVGEIKTIDDAKKKISSIGDSIDNGIATFTKPAGIERDILEEIGEKISDAADAYDLWVVIVERRGESKYIIYFWFENDEDYYWWFSKVKK